MKTKKAAIEQIQNLIAPLVGIGVVLAIGFLILAAVQDQIESTDSVNQTCQNTAGDLTSAACNASQTVQNALQDIPGWLPIIVITVIGALLLGLVYMFMGNR